MAFNTVIQQGSFVSNALPVELSIRSDVDIFRVKNFMHWGAGAVADTAVEFFWQRGFVDNQALMTYYDAAGPVLLTGFAGTGDGVSAAVANSAGITLVSDLNTPQIGGLNPPTTNITAATQPVVSTGDTTGLLVGDTVRVPWVSGNTASPNFYDFDISAVTANTNFTQAFDLADACANGGNGTWLKINRNSVWYPRTRSIINIERSGTGTVPAGVTRIHFSVTHDYTVGQALRIHVPATLSPGIRTFGIPQIDGLVGNITTANTPVIATATSNWVEVDIDSAGFTDFQTPTTNAQSNVTATWPYVNPIGIDTAQALSGNVNITDDATRNTGIIGLSLNLGASTLLSPCGTTADVLYWEAIKAF